MGDMIPVFIVMTIFATMGWIVHVFVDGRRRRERLKVFTEFHSRLIDRMGSAKEFAEFLQTTGGQNFLDTLSLERGHPADRIARAVQVGVILTSVGLALFLSMDRVATEIEGGYYVLAAIILSLGIGFMLSAVSSYALARTFGLLHKAELRDELTQSRAWPVEPPAPPRS
jgi:hypothetical protein